MLTIMCQIHILTSRQTISSSVLA